VLAGFEITGLDPASQRELLLGAQERDLVDLLEIGLEAAFGGNGWAPGEGLGGIRRETIGCP
jgi:hypothetical protein